METTKYQIENCIEQAKRITAEYPKITSVSFRIENCPLADINSIAYANGDKPQLEDNKMKLCIHDSIGDRYASYFIHLESKPLIVSEPVIVEG